LKHFAERTFILVADIPGHLANRATGQFEHLARLTNAQTLTIFRRIELRQDNLALVQALREAKRIVDDAGDNATSGVLDGWTDLAEERAWFLFEASQGG